MVGLVIDAQSVGVTGKGVPLKIRPQNVESAAFLFDRGQTLAQRGAATCPGLHSKVGLSGR